MTTNPLRDPTEAMLTAARDWSDKKYGKPIGNDAAIGCWQAMLDAHPEQPAPDAVAEAAKTLQRWRDAQITAWVDAGGLIYDAQRKFNREGVAEFLNRALASQDKEAQG